MKKKLFIILLSIIPIIIIYEFTYNEKQDYLAIGDGLSLGWTHYGSIGYGYSDYINNYLNERKKLKTFNKSFSRKNIEVMDLIKDIDINKSTINNGKKVYLQNAISNAELITISIGNNEMSDILKYNNSTKESFIKTNKLFNEITYLLEKVRNISKEKIVLIGFYSYGKENNSELVNYINKKLEKKCKKLDITFINTNNIFDNNIKYIPNTLENYPNYKGYRKIGEEIVKKVKI